jgi:hypothetical protein
MSKAFDWAVNLTGKDQGYTTNLQSGITIEKGVVVDTQILNGGTGNLTPVHDVLETVKIGEPWFCQRTFAVGDVLMLVPVVRWLRHNGHDVTIRTVDDMFDIVRRLGVPAEAANFRGNKGNKGIILDFVVEKDHTVPYLQKKHRVDIYAEAIGLARQDRPAMWDWSMDLSKFGEFEFMPEKPFVVFQGRGSGDRRSLSKDAIEWIVTAMNCEGIDVAYIGEDIGLRQPSGTDGKTYVFNRRFSLREIFLLIGRAKAIVTMDSAPLWMAHFAKTPTVALLGPTRVEERLSKHPLYPEGAVGIELASNLGCQPCFENATRTECQQKGFMCLKQEPDVIYSRMRKHLMRFWEA